MLSRSWTTTWTGCEYPALRPLPPTQSPLETSQPPTFSPWGLNWSHPLSE